MKLIFSMFLWERHQLSWDVVMIRQSLGCNSCLELNTLYAEWKSKKLVLMCGLVVTWGAPRKTVLPWWEGGNCRQNIWQAFQTPSRPSSQGQRKGWKQLVIGCNFFIHLFSFTVCSGIWGSRQRCRRRHLSRCLRAGNEASRSASSSCLPEISLSRAAMIKFFYLQQPLHTVRQVLRVVVPGIRRPIIPQAWTWSNIFPAFKKQSK